MKRSSNGIVDLIVLLAMGVAGYGVRRFWKKFNHPTVSRARELISVKKAADDEALVKRFRDEIASLDGKDLGEAFE